VARTTIDRIIKRYFAEGTIASRFKGSNRKITLTELHRDFIRNKVDEDCSISLKRLQGLLKSSFDVVVSVATIHRALDTFHYTLKRVSFIPERRNEPDIIIARHDYATQARIFLEERAGHNVFFY
jgi:transposase